MGQDTVQTDAGGDASGTDGFSCSSKIPEAGDVVTATATNTSATPASGTSFGDTSVFSRNVRVGVVF